MIRNFIKYTILLCAFPAISMAAEPAPTNDTRLTIGAPVYVTHPHNRGGSKGWNEGWFNNEGLMADVTWPEWQVNNSTNVRIGLTGGVFDNSVYKTSVFVGGVIELETRATENIALSVGTYAGGITGYDYAVSPAIAPYLGASYLVTESLEIGARGYWLPSKTLAGSSISPSDSYVGAITLGTRF